MRMQCPKCLTHDMTYYTNFDAFGCEKCDVWEAHYTHCEGKECDAGFLQAPERPSLVPAHFRREKFNDS